MHRRATEQECRCLVALNEKRMFIARENRFFTYLPETRVTKQRWELEASYVHQFLTCKVRKKTNLPAGKYDRWLYIAYSAVSACFRSRRSACCHSSLSTKTVIMVATWLSTLASVGMAVGPPLASDNGGNCDAFVYTAVRFMPTKHSQLSRRSRLCDCLDACSCLTCE